MKYKGKQAQDQRPEKLKSPLCAHFCGREGARGLPRYQGSTSPPKRAEGHPGGLGGVSCARSRKPNGRGIISLEVLNILDEQFHFQNRDLLPEAAPSPRYAPERTLYARASLRF